jgi:S1-C subfamily serine protease
MAGDIISELNRRKVTDVKTFRAAIAASGQGQEALLRVQRGETVRYLAVKP